ncbi:MAG TPA: translation initiation factor IF-2 [Acidimicrobiales bacterium]|nr:translation initiation factor IF-2 [Acidimicrobiales bacterium]
MAGKIRVYELARELGLENKETVDLCNSLGIGVKSHSSSIVEPQADRVRRKAEREGLIREPKPAEADGDGAAATEAEKPAKKAAPAKKVVAKKAAAAPKPAPPTPEVEARPEAPAAPEPPAAPAAAPAAPAAAAPTPPPAAPPAPPKPAAAEAPAPPRPPAARPAAGVVKSSGSEHPPARPREEEPAAAAPVPPAPAAAPKPPAQAPRPPAAAPQPPAAAEAPRPPAAPADPGAKPGQKAPPKSASGKPIPPPPGPMVSRTGKPIPPPPGAGGRGPAPAPSGPGNRPPRRGAAGQVRYTPPPPGGGPRPGGGGPGGGPGGGRPGPGGARRPPKRRGGRRRRNREELQPLSAPSFTPHDAPIPDHEVVIERASTPQDIGPKLNRTASDVVRFLMEQGEMVTATQSLSDDMIELFAAELGATIRLVDPGEEAEVELQKRLGVDELLGVDEVDESVPHRPPVVTIMGHVDHGKTKLLDYIREANVVAGEAGGITQHIGAYQAEKDGQKVTFIDTPGHEAFTAMRARGAQATDIVVLVVAADDGVMPQTVEALNHAKAADVPIIVAVNKIDKEAANPDRVMQQLSEYDLIPEEWGGETIFAKVSALTGEGVEDLLENLLVVAEIEDLRADPEGRAAGSVLESHLDIGRGPVATVLVQRGTLRVGDPMVAGAAWGRVRALIDDHGNQVKEAGPSAPVQVLGLSDVADAGDQFIVAPDDKTARDVADKREHFHRLANLGREATATGGGAKLEDIFAAIQAGEVATLSLVLKADVNGSLEALTDSLKKLERDDVKIGFVHRAVGGITENDIQLASASNATIIGFNVRPDRKARELAEAEGVEIRTYEIIYKVLEDMEAAMLGMLAPEYEEVVTGDAEVREIFSVPRIGKIAGCMVLDGVITRGSKVRFLREGTIIWKGSIQSLKRFKEDATEVRAGFECGIGLSDFQDLKEGDIIETYEEREIART